MMHHHGTIVTIRDRSGTAYREYAHQRTVHMSRSTVTLPFDSEFQIGIGIQDGFRRRAEISIDGQDLGELIFSGSYTVLDRFIRTDKRFKFVAKDHAAVADPTSADNGIVRIKVWKEKPYILTTTHYPHGQPWWLANNYATWSTCGTTGDGCVLGGCTPSSAPWNGDATSPQSLYSSSLRSCNLGDVGATVEGSQSGQTFGSTTWSGDQEDCYSEFCFDLRGYDDKTVVSPCNLESRTHKFCTECGAKQLRDARFCHDCGVPNRTC